MTINKLELIKKMGEFREKQNKEQIKDAKEQLMIGDRIKILRTRLGLSLAAFGDNIGVSKQNVYSWEVGRANPRADVVNTIAQTYGVSTDWLYNGNDFEEIEKESATKDYGDLPQLLIEVAEKHGYGYIFDNFATYTLAEKEDAILTLFKLLDVVKINDSKK